jgi:acetyl esterase/lipase
LKYLGMASAVACIAAMVGFEPPAVAQVPRELADSIARIGDVINPPETARLYAPLQPAEPYPGVRISRDLSYGPADRNTLDVFEPETASPAPRPVLIFVHGGAFVGGNKRSPPGAVFYDNIMLWAVRNGFIGVNTTYRLAPQNPWPAGAQDLGAAVRWVTQNIAARGGDPGRIFLMGHSAGAVHVASYVAGPMFHAAGGSGLAGAIMLSGIYDTTTTEVNGPLKAYFGNDPARYAERSPLPGLLKTTVPLMIEFAELDPPDFQQQAEQVRAALCKAGRCPRFLRLAAHSHMSEVYSLNTADRALGDAIVAFTAAAK